MHNDPSHVHERVSFARFMERALYHPTEGYYRRQRSPFGAEGDFYTAVQLAPFREVIRRYVTALALNFPGGGTFDIVDLGAGTAGLSDALGDWRYTPVDWSLSAFPSRIHGLVIANEF